MRNVVTSLLVAASFLAAFEHPRILAATVPLTGITIVGAGEGPYGLAVREDGVVLAWGNNASGTLGNGTTDPSLLPKQVFGLGVGSGVIAVAPSFPFALALKADGTVLGWGANALGQLGDGTFDNRLTPVTVSGFGSGSGVIAITVGLSHSVALKSDGSVWTWGSNNNGNLGNPAIVGPSNVPVPVSGLGSGAGVVAIAAGGNFTLALKSDSTVWAWGNNNNGQLGIGNIANQPVPVQVKGPGAVGALSGITAVSAPPAGGGAFAMALRMDGSVWAWGNNSNGQLGDGTTTNRTSPVQVKGVGGSGLLGNVVNIDAAGGANNLHALAVTSDGSVLAWGSNANGQLGTGNNTPSSVPLQVPGLDNGITAVSGAAGLSFALKSDGSLLAWGDNSNGQLGDGSFFGRATPGTVAGFGNGSSIRMISTQISANHSFAVLDDGTVMGWGRNSSGQLGTGDALNRVVPTLVPGLADVSATAVGAGHSLALKTDGSVWAWGDNGMGQLGIGTMASHLTPVQVKTSATTPLTGVVAITAGANSSYALTSDGLAWAWGNNNVGQLGVNSQINQLFATPVHGVADSGLLTGVIVIAAVAGSGFALLSDGAVVAWGQNAAGQLGDGTNAQRLTPVQVSGLGPGSAVVAIASIAGGAAVLKDDGTVLAWGLNGSGQVGDGTAISRNTPTEVTGLGPSSGVIALAGGGELGQGHTLAVKSDGAMLSWGTNASGQLGDGTLMAHFVPEFVADTSSPIRHVAAGFAHSLALTAADTVLSWGANGSGQLGDGTTYTKNLTPANVLIEDVTPPAFSSIHLTPSIVGGQSQIMVSSTVSDGDSGVAAVAGRVQGPAPSTTTIGTIALMRQSGTPFNGAWSGMFTFPTNAADGTFTVTASATDGAGNEATVTHGTVVLDRTAPTVSASASQTTLWPPNGKLVTVDVTGMVADAGSGIGQTTYGVTDEYGVIALSGAVPLDTAGAFRVSVQLVASRRDDDRDGRRYVIVVAAKDRAGNSQSSSVAITVPHGLK